ncbi:MAG: hypothetical protein DKM50_12255 [Candidatus Margulisiibacteriota bacterium]|nr:MAG: hypothetical protein A2X43_01050 [Candidatus Margulisbacteria bacterium GWD2_39_127]OGI02413.1 MAG: hypothetical protein A2X42_09700 [Candidatus Margulisbacteria bacterium GWF2_38_17]OGI08546.1 MAG: hypothetical protein A2X41_07485 [Candidatus Margulisbacteria bacterium GWE2_39_32]PZM78198.1 MAG: hypothetical protein DKM50_12255 [Candidatus Margulisiibacteriota bacterium]HAR63459.1 hypothetical protein [Candidatus Margulisiibacteriota bacterium]
MLSKEEELLAENFLLKRALYANDLNQLMEVLRLVNVESIVEYDITEEGIKLQEEWGVREVSEYHDRSKIDPNKEYNQPLLNVIGSSEPFFIEKGSKYLKRKDQGSIFLIPKMVDNQIKRIYKVQSKEDNDLFNPKNTELFTNLILAVVRKKEEIDQREKLIEIIKNITAKMTLNERLNEIVKIVDNLAFIDKCAIKLYEDGLLVVKAVSANFNSYINNSTSIELEKQKDTDKMATSSIAFFTKQPVSEQYLDPNKSKAAAEGLLSMLSIPLIGDNDREAIGVLNVFTEKEHNFKEDEINIIEKFADLAALTIIEADIYEKNIKMNQKLQQALKEKERTLIELEETQGKLVKAEKLAVLGEIAVSVNHEINNPLTAIMLLAQVMKNKVVNNPELRSEITERTSTIIEYIYKIQNTLEQLNKAAKSDNILSKEYVTGTNMIDLEGMSQKS